MQEHALWRSDTHSVKHVLVRHGEHHRLDQLLDLLVRPSNVAVILRRPLIHLHSFHTRVKLSRKFLQNEIRILVCAHKVRWFQVRDVNKTGDRKIDCLTCRCTNYSRARFPRCVHIGRGTLLSLFRREPILRLRFQHLHHVPHQVRKLLVQLNLLLVLPNPISLPPALVCNTLNVGLHNPNVVPQEVDALPQFSRGHVPRLIVEGRVVLVICPRFLLRLAGGAAASR
mmetsp:Transcript_7861/g.23192  ORF Transcript_7861/g.23192 Transcript_7861/m.23192 type:complete len:227 (+) Transcript_7861:699-1379(+)